MIIYLSMLFVVFETLSMIFNQFFSNITIFEITFPLNISVVFFCLGFFILDMVTELYNNTIANKIIYGKIICQIAFIIFAEIGISGAGLQNTQIAQIIETTPWMILNGIIASIIGYKITINLMQNLKIIYRGKHMILRYLFSSLPGEIAFSLVFAGLSFSKGKSFSEFCLIFISLSLVKLFLSLAFSIIIVPITKILQPFAKRDMEHLSFMPIN